MQRGTFPFWHHYIDEEHLEIILLVYDTSNTAGTIFQMREKQWETEWDLMRFGMICVLWEVILLCSCVLSSKVTKMWQSIPLSEAHLASEQATVSHSLATYFLLPWQKSWWYKAGWLRISIYDAIWIRPCQNYLDIQSIIQVMPKQCRKKTKKCK